MKAKFTKQINPEKPSQSQSKEARHDFLALIFLICISILTTKTFGTETTGGCPLANKCPYYQAIESGKKFEDIDWDNTNCPAAGKCPYYEKLKEKAVSNDGKLPTPQEAGCPYTEKCPHFKDQNHNHHVDGDATKCPYLTGGGKHSEDAVAKCPHLQKLAVEKRDNNKDEL
ncbi:2174_t:CDS:2 [Entrophospora sp. SA101]|nr:2174_t:CDS:2 [Entrophospora sp. SA101]